MFSSKWKEIAELVGLAAILTGMYFVYAEIQQNSVIARAELSSLTNQRMYELRDRRVDHDFSALYLKGLHTPAELHENERHQLDAYFSTVIQQMVYEYRMYRLGLFGEYEEITGYLAEQYYAIGYGRAWWNVARSQTVPEIARVVDQVLVDTDIRLNWIERDAEIIEQIEALQ